MATRPTPLETDEDELPPAEQYNAAEEEVIPGETMDDYMARHDENDSRWRGKQGAKGASKHDANDHRTMAAKFQESETWDPHMGNN